MISASTLKDYVPVPERAAPAGEGVLRRALSRIIAARAEAAELQVAAYLARTDPDRARELGYDVEALKRRAVSSFLHL